MTGLNLLYQNIDLALCAMSPPRIFSRIYSVNRCPLISILISCFATLRDLLCVLGVSEFSRPPKAQDLLS